MPTKDEFDDAARAFRDSADNIESELPKLDRDWTDAIKGGTLEVLVPQAIVASQGNVRLVCGKLRDLAGVCDQRAQACLTYEGEVKAYNDKLDSYYDKLHYYRPVGGAEPPVKPPQPDEPPSWLDSRIAMHS